MTCNSKLYNKPLTTYVLLLMHSFISTLTMRFRILRITFCFLPSVFFNAVL